MRALSLISDTNPVRHDVFRRVNKEDYVFAPSTLRIHKVGGIFIFFYARFVHSIRMDKVRLG